MRTIRTKVYKFHELPQEIQSKVIDKHYDINIDYEWWEFIYEDAKNVGIKIREFDIDRGNYCKGEFILGTNEVARKIILEHGKECETYKTAFNFLKEWSNLVEKYSDGININIVSEENEWEFDKEADELEKEFINDILEDYRIILQKEYEYLTSYPAIIETICANDYEFTINGEMI